MSVITTNGADPQAAEKAAETDRKILDEIARQGRVAELRANGWKVDLSGGQSATLADPETLTERKARAIKVAMIRSAPDGKTMDPEQSVDSAYVTVAAFLQSWTLSLELPTVGKTDSLLDLSAKDYRILENAAADVRAEVFVDFTATPEALQDTGSPFGAPSA